MTTPDSESPCLRNRQERRLAVLFFVVALIVLGTATWLLSFRGDEAVVNAVTQTVPHD